MSVLYADTSALLKRVVPEVESSQVRATLEARRVSGDLVVASSLAWLELWRTFRRLGRIDISQGVDDACAGVDEFPLDEAVLRTARSVGTDSLRSLDAIHLASAFMVGADAIVTYDDRLADAATAIGIDVMQPRQN